MITGYRALPVLVLGLLSTVAQADAIRIDGRWLEDVYISSSENFHYVMDPRDGTVRNVRCSDVSDGDVVIDSDLKARQQLLREWETRRNGEEPETEEPEESVAIGTPGPANDGTGLAPGTRISEFEYLERKQLEDLVRFEAELEQWRERSPEEREQIFGDLVARIVEVQGEEALSAVAAEVARAEASLHLQELSSRSEEIEAAIGTSRASEAERLRELNQRASQSYYQGLLEDVLLRRLLWYPHLHFPHRPHRPDKPPQKPDPEMPDNPRHPRHPHRFHGLHPTFSDLILYNYWGATARESARAAAEAARIAQEEAAYREAQRQKLDALNRQASEVRRQQQAAEFEARRVARLANSEAYWAGVKLHRITLLEAAIENDYESQLRYEQLGLWQGEASEQTDPFTVRGPVWKLDLKVWGRGRVRVRVLSEPDGRLVHMLTGSRPPIWVFQVLDKPGRYRLDIDVTGPVSYTLEAVQVKP